MRGGRADLRIQTARRGRHELDRDRRSIVGVGIVHELTDMKLLREPRPFSLHTSRHIMRMIGSADPSWRRYLYFESEPAA